MSTPQTTSRQFVTCKDGKFYWIDVHFKEHDIERIDDLYLVNILQFLYKKHSHRALEYSILLNEFERREKIKNTEIGSMLYK